MEIVLFVIDVILVMFLLSKQLYLIGLWFLFVIMFQMSYLTGNEHIYLEIIEDYPIQDCLKPKQFKFLYRKLNKLSDKGIPKEMYYCETIKVYGFIICSIAALFSFFINENITLLFGKMYFWLFVALSLVSANLLKKKSFIERYKLLNKFNIKYLFRPEDEPTPRKIGKCHIISKTKQRGRVFVTVRVLETNELTERVLLQSKITNEKNDEYCLYEICNVFYVEKENQ